MGIFTVIFIIVLAVIADYYLFDVDRKRWGWLKTGSKLTKGLFVSGLIAASILIYFGISIEYMK